MTNFTSFFISFFSSPTIGSGQQLVTVAEDNRSPQGLWQVREAHDEGNIVPPACLTGAPVPCGKTIRLNHVVSLRFFINNLEQFDTLIFYSSQVTGSNLHTHDIRSPLSNQQEVSGFGRDGSTDLGDDWIVVCNTGHWKRDTPMQLRSAATNRYLGASSSVKFTEQNCGRGCPILNHLELFGREANDLYTQWKVELGVHLHK